MRLHYYGDPVLRKRAKPVKEITEEIRSIIAGMIKIMTEAKGIGIAAPQVGHSLRIFVSIVHGQDEEGETIYGEPYALINPTISNISEELTEMEEGCLSIPDLYIPIVRPYSIDIQAMDIDGKLFEKKCEDFLARHYLHEFDHLEGILTVDRLKGKRRTAIESELRRIKKKYKQN